MGLIREPKDVDFYVLGKTSLSPDEEKEFSAYLKKLKSKIKPKRSTIKKRTKVSLT